MINPPDDWPNPDNPEPDPEDLDVEYYKESGERVYHSPPPPPPPPPTRLINESEGLGYFFMGISLISILFTVLFAFYMEHWQ